MRALECYARVLFLSHKSHKENAQRRITLRAHVNTLARLNMV